MAIFLIADAIEALCARPIAAVCALSHVDRAELSSRSRFQRIVAARQLAIFICREMTDLSTVDIGKVFNRDHATVIHAIRKIRRRCEASPGYRSIVDRLIGNLRAEQAA